MTEIAHLLRHPADFSNLDLSQLPTTATTAGVAGRFVQFMRLAGYAALKTELQLTGDVGGFLDPRLEEAQLGVHVETKR